jgi:hypothetical protein
MDILCVNQVSIFDRCEDSDGRAVLILLQWVSKTKALSRPLANYPNFEHKLKSTLKRSLIGHHFQPFYLVGTPHSGRCTNDNVFV